MAVTLTDALDTAATVGARLSVLDDGRVRLLDPAGAVDREARAALRANRDLLAAHLRGHTSGHALAPCTGCGQATLVAVKTTAGKIRTLWPSCRLSPGCEGRHIPSDRDITDRASTPPPISPGVSPARPSTARLLGPRPPYPTWHPRP